MFNKLEIKGKKESKFKVMTYIKKSNSKADREDEAKQSGNIESICL